MKKTLSGEEVRKLFRKESVYIFGRDLFPYDKAVEVFGEAAIKRARDKWVKDNQGDVKSLFFNGYGFSPDGVAEPVQIMGFSFAAFDYIASSYNLLTLAETEAEKEKAATVGSWLRASGCFGIAAGTP